MQFFYVIPALLLASYVVYQRFFSPFARIPGPFWASLSRWWLVWVARFGNYNYKMIELHKLHGDVVRIGPGEVSVADLAAIKQIYGAGSKFRKSDWYSVWQGHRKFDLFGERDERLHGVQRRYVARAYAMDVLKDLEPYVDEAIETFMRRMGDMKGQVVDMGQWVQFFAFDVVGEVTFATSFGFLEAGKDDGILHAVKVAAISGAWLGQVPWLYWLHDALMPYIGNWVGINMRHGGIRSFALRETKARQERNGNRKDILSKLFETNKEKPNEFSFNDVVSMVTSNVNAGSDTTAVSTRSILYHLLKNPQYKQRLRDEIDGLRKAGKLSDPVTFDEANSMPYLQACIWEGLRMHPAVGVNLTRVVPPGGTEIAGRFIPAGGIVGTNAWVVHQNQNVYGEDANVFRPDRWLGEDVGDMHRYFFSFGSGSRLCLGKNISWIEMSKLVPTLFMRYDMELANPEADWKEHTRFFVFQEDFNVRLRPRHAIEV